MLYMASFGDQKFKKSKARLLKSAVKYGVEKIISADEEYIFRDEDFVLKNRFILRQRRGYGYWLWKPYLIHKVLNDNEFASNVDNVLFYCDSGVEILKPLSILTNLLEDEPLLFRIDKRNDEYVKMAIYEAAGIRGERLVECKQAHQIGAGYCFFRNNDYSREFVAEWLRLCETPFLITDCPIPKIKESSNFIENRHDQAILSVLCYKHGIKTYVDPSQFGNGDKDREFEQIFELHRKRSKPYFKRERLPFGKLWNKFNSRK